MADRSRGDGWWQASDGKWYPPELLDAPRPQWPTTEQVAVVVPNPDGDPPSPKPVIISVLIASAVSLLAAIASWSLASAVRGSDEPAFVDGVPTHSAETGLWSLATGLSGVALIVGAVLMIVWMFKLSKMFDARGASGRTWSAGWTIAGWMIPLASFVIPKLVFSEMEKLAKVPYGGDPIGTRWKQHERSSQSDLWWLLWVAGNASTIVLTVGGNLSIEDSDRFTVFLTLSAIGSVLVAAAGIVLVLTIRLMDANATQ